MREALVELLRRQALAENDRSAHRGAGRHIEAAACEIRIQALREAGAIVKVQALPPNQMRQSGGRRSAEGGGEHGEG